MVQTALRPAVVDFVHLATSSERLDLSMEQVHINNDSALANQSLIDAGIRQRFGVIVVGIKRAGGGMEFNPSPEAVMRPGDELVVLGTTDNVKALEKEKGVVA
jgi:voltage-gated potassium channel